MGLKRSIVDIAIFFLSIIGLILILIVKTSFWNYVGAGMLLLAVIISFWRKIAYIILRQFGL